MFNVRRLRGALTFARTCWIPEQYAYIEVMMKRILNLSFCFALLCSRNMLIPFYYELKSNLCERLDVIFKFNSVIWPREKMRMQYILLKNLQRFQTESRELDIIYAVSAGPRPLLVSRFRKVSLLLPIYPSSLTINAETIPVNGFTLDSRLWDFIFNLFCSMESGASSSYLTDHWFFMLCCSGQKKWGGSKHYRSFPTMVRIAMRRRRRKFEQFRTHQQFPPIHHHPAITRLFFCWNNLSNFGIFSLG